MKTDSKFRQRAKVGVAGNLINQIMSNNDTLPEVGKGATEMLYSDRLVYEVIEVSKDFKTVKLECLDAKIDPEYLKALNGRDCIGHQNWVFEPTGRFITVVWRHNAWRRKCTVIKYTKDFIAMAEKNGHFAFAKALTPEQHKAVYGNDVRPQNVVEGITEQKFEYHALNLIFGRKDYRYDWEI